ncbi:MAG: hypothetical protein ACREIS_14790 [Nitrospiraceae bacterium]
MKTSTIETIVIAAALVAAFLSVSSCWKSASKHKAEAFGQCIETQRHLLSEQDPRRTPSECAQAILDLRIE